jgi:glutathione S-transferase
MTDTILFYTPGACSLACQVALEWLGQPYRLCRIEKEIRGGAIYRLVNPRAQVPALRVDGRILCETNAILTHIADRDPAAQLLPSNGTWERDVANQGLAQLNSGFHPAFWPYFSPQRYVKEESMFESVKAAALDAMGRELALVNGQLSQRTFMLGDTRSVLDAYLQAMARWANKLVDMPALYPQVWRHQKLMAKDPAVRLGQAIERGETVSIGPGGFQGHVELATLVATG